MIPRLKFRYSWVYDRFFESYAKEIKSVRKTEYPSREKIMKYIGEIEKLWGKNGKAILKNIQKVSGLKWKKNTIKVYVVGRTPASISDPLTMAIVPKDKKLFMEILTHELIHVIQSDNSNSELWVKWSKFVEDKYGNEAKLVKSHIFLHSVHKEIYLKTSGKRRLQKEISRMAKYPEYRRSWEIVERGGHENIIKLFKKGIK